MDMVGVSKDTASATETMGRLLRVPKIIAEAFLRMLIEIVYVFASVSSLVLQLSSAFLNSYSVSASKTIRKAYRYCRFLIHAPGRISLLVLASMYYSLTSSSSEYALDIVY